MRIQLMLVWALIVICGGCGQENQAEKVQVSQSEAAEKGETAQPPAAEDRDEKDEEEPSAWDRLGSWGSKQVDAAKDIAEEAGAAAGELVDETEKVASELSTKVANTGKEIAKGTEELVSESGKWLGAQWDSTEDVMAGAWEEGQRLGAEAADWSSERMAKAQAALADVTPTVVQTYGEVERTMGRWIEEGKQAAVRIHEEDLQQFFSAVGVQGEQLAVQVVELTDKGLLTLTELEAGTEDIVRKHVDLSALGLSEESAAIAKSQIRGALVGMVKGVTTMPKMMMISVQLPARLASERNFGPNLVARVVHVGNQAYLKVSTTPAGEIAQELGSFALDALSSGDVTERIVQVATMAAVTRLVEGLVKSAINPADGFEVDASRITVVDGDTIKLPTECVPEALRSGKKFTSIRLRSINTPETVHPWIAKQPFGSEASAFTKKIFGDAKKVRILNPTAANYSRIESRVLLLGGKKKMDWGEQILSRGLGKVDRRYIANLHKKALERYEVTQSAAKKLNHGMWSVLP